MLSAVGLSTFGLDRACSILRLSTKLTSPAVTRSERGGRGDVDSENTPWRCIAIHEKTAITSSLLIQTYWDDGSLL